MLSHEQLDVREGRDQIPRPFFVVIVFGGVFEKQVDMGHHSRHFSNTNKEKSSTVGGGRALRLFKDFGKDSLCSFERCFVWVGVVVRVVDGLGRHTLTAEESNQ